VSNLPFDDDVRAASTPPGAFYGADAFAAQRARLFPRTWHLAPLPAGGLPPGHVAPWTMLPGTLDEPLLWTSDGDGAHRCLSNVCTHRGNVIVDTPGPRHALRCGYHGRTFDLCGRLQSAPNFETARDFPRPSDDLPAPATGEWAGLRFAALQPAMPFATWIAPVQQLMAHWLEAARPATPAYTRDYEFDANWALYVDNYLEGMHVPFVHPTLTPTLELRAYGYELSPWSTLQIGAGRPDEPSLSFPPGHRLATGRIAGLYFWLFPCTMLNFYPWGLNVNVVEPLGPARTRLRHVAYVTRPELQTRGAGGDLDTVEREDQGVVTATQRGVSARLYDRGRYAPRHEAGLHHFHRLVAALL
jgi:choline monooxygenase